MQGLERRICQEDEVKDITLVCLNNSLDAARELAGLDMNDRSNWGRLKIVMIPNEGAIKGYLPRSLFEDFKSLSSADKSSYAVFDQMLSGDNA